VRSLGEAIRENGVSMCVDCGKCSAVCPITAFETKGYASPRRLVETALCGSFEALPDETLFWACLTCRRCSELCPSEVHFPEFIRDLRRMAASEGRSGPSTHGGVVTCWMRIMTDQALEQNRLQWLTADLETSETSDTVFFVGCLPYYAELFRDTAFEGMEIARGAIRILNRMGIRPQVSADERCCGHDRLWQGDIETFRSLAALNLRMLENTGATRIVTACPECARTLELDYPRLAGAHGMEVLHVSQIAAAGISSGALKFEPGGDVRRAAYHDPCRLGRHLGIYDEPRSLMDGIGFHRVEMAHSRASSVCCGTSCWTACGLTNKLIQSERLGEAAAAGAELLVTACLKCQIHLLCARKDPSFQNGSEFPIRDITTLAAGALAAT